MISLRNLESKEEELPNAVEIIKDRLYFTSLRVQPRTIPNVHFFSIDNAFVYEAFFADFGPLNLGHVYIFCQLLDKKLVDVRLLRKKLYLFTSYDSTKRTNAAFLVGAYLVIRQKMSPEEAFKPFEGLQNSFLPFRDASVGISTFNITILDCLKAIHKAIQHSFFDYDNFNLEEYQFYEKVENGDLNWIVPGKFIAFCGPSSVFTLVETGQKTYAPEDYIPLFKKFGVSTVVRLNKKEYDRASFTAQGIKHYDLYFMDGSAPSDSILRRFLDIAENEPGVIAVHCKAGLGRTGTLITSYIMKHYHFTANEGIAWARICRPGSVIGPQQHFLSDLQSRLWKQGELMKKKKTNSPQSTQNKTNNSTEDITNSLRIISVGSQNSSSGSNSNNSNSSGSSMSSPSPHVNQIRTITQTYNLRERSTTIGSPTQTAKYGTKPSTLKRTKSANAATIRTVSATLSSSTKMQRTVSIYATRTGSKRHGAPNSTVSLLLDKRK